MTTHGNYLDGKWQTGSGAPLQSFDPYNRELVWEGAMSNAADVATAVAAARHAFPHWSSLETEARYQLLQGYAQLLQDHKQELAETISQEVGKPLWESLTEVTGMIGKIDVSRTAFDERCRHKDVPVAGGRSVTRFKPHGVCAVFGPFNFPGNLPNGHIVPALLAGNTIVFKPSELSPMVGQRLAELLERSSLPPGVFNLIQGDKDTGIALANHLDVDGLFFTGSCQAGKAIHKSYGGHPEKILALEMGGNNPLIVHDLDDIQAAIYWTIQSAYLTSGQRCVCARRLIVTDSETNQEFLRQLPASLQHIRAGHFRERPEPFMGPVISAHAADQILQQQAALQQQGGNLLVRVAQTSGSTALLSPGLIDVTDVPQRPDEEIFGPLLQIIRVDDLDAAILEANRTVFGLAATIFCQRRTDYESFQKRIRAGIVNWNKPTTGASSTAPFGGIGQSGNHNPSAYFAADYCSFPVASMESETLRVPPTLTPGIELNC